MRARGFKIVDLKDYNWHTGSMQIVWRDEETGKLLVTGEMGIVLVLLPGGSFWMGAQQDFPRGHNFDPDADITESPPHEIPLGPFFMSKYEMTQGQWRTITGHNPSKYPPDTSWLEMIKRGDITLAHPVERVSWEECSKGH